MHKGVVASALLWKKLELFYPSSHNFLRIISCEVLLKSNPCRLYNKVVIIPNELFHCSKCLE